MFDIKKFIPFQRYRYKKITRDSDKSDFCGTKTAQLFQVRAKLLVKELGETVSTFLLITIWPLAKPIISLNSAFENGRLVAFRESSKI